ncbi:hypothetical protein NIES2135_62110 (plasmid) [Leptolyngbya boryana NIES-2135]|jgi:hypothetical protein|uniref:Uncharacterized protein n=1 Tax=Leptolyngbya boryana NIES-2135 TaxID=1973484 RepID=A0A1Z4JRK5_LEPBY|nr:hypothetical protein NIES2135_62110 [Leptolyngbya boryana NIES-2135]
MNSLSSVCDALSAPCIQSLRDANAGGICTNFSCYLYCKSEDGFNLRMFWCFCTKVLALREEDHFSAEEARQG